MQKLDPRTRLLLICCFTTLSVLSINAFFLAITLFFCVITILLFKADLKSCIKKTRHLLTVVLFVAIMQSIFIKGRGLVSIGNFCLFSVEGVVMGLEFILRMCIIIFSATIATTAKDGEMLNGLIKLKIPYELAYMVSISIKFLPIFRKEFANRVNAIALRGVEIRKLGLIRKMKTYAYFLSPTIASAILKSKELSVAMLSKGFRAYAKRTSIVQLHLTTVDVFVILLTIVATAVFLTLMYMYGAMFAI